MYEQISPSTDGENLLVVNLAINCKSSRIMNHLLNRRLFLKRAVVTAGALSAARFLPGPNLLQAASPGDKLTCVLIGCGGRGLSAHLGPASGQNLRGIVDVNEKRHEAVKKVLQGK